SRDFIRFDGTGLASYAPGFDPPDFPERGYRTVLVESGLPLLAFFQKVPDPGEEVFTLVFTASGDFELVQEIAVPAGSSVIHASFDQSGDYQFLFHIPGSDTFSAFTWDGSALNPAGNFSLGMGVDHLYPVVNTSTTGLLAVVDGGNEAIFYTFDGFQPPAPEQTMGPPTGHFFDTAIAREDGSLVLFSGQPGKASSSVAELYLHDGSEFVHKGDTGLPNADLYGQGSNILLFSEKPFIVENAALTGRMSAGVWTTAVVLGGSDVEAEVEAFGGTATGLQNPATVFVGPKPPASTEALPNQVGGDISLHDRSPALGSLPGTVRAEPQGGVFQESVSVTLFPSDPTMLVSYRVLPDGEWMSGTGPVGPRYESFALQYFGQMPDGRRTPMQTADYSVTVSPSDLDSDSDGVPDFVEIDAGLDPVNSGDDSDGDGYGDKIELLAGADPNDPLSVPPSREIDSDGDGFSDLEETIAGTDPNDPLDKPNGSAVLNFQNVFDLVAVPWSHDGSGSGNPFVASLDAGAEMPGGDPLATNVRLHNPSGSLIGFDRTALQGKGPTVPHAYLDGVDVANPERFLVVSTERDFNIDVAHPDPRRGRQVAGLVNIPALSLDPIPHAYGSAGGNLPDEAAAWIAAARAHLLSTPRPEVLREFDLLDTLTLLLVELRVEEILRSRGIIGPDPVTFTGFRSGEVAVALDDAPGDGSRSLAVPGKVLESLRHKTNGSDTGYLLRHIFEVTDTAVESGTDPAVLALREVATAIYRISADQANDNPGTLVPPLDALRKFIRTGSLEHTGYMDDPAVAPLDPATLSSAATGTAYLLGLETRRPVEYRQLEVISGGISGSCTVLQDTATQESVSLIDFNGNRFAMPDAFRLPESSIVWVEGYADVDSDCSADTVLEVIPPLQLIFLPVSNSADANADLIPDDLEDLYGVSLYPFADTDGDGYSDLQEILDGTNPTDPAAFSGNPPMDLTPPEVTTDFSSPTTITFAFEFPDEYAEAVTFNLFSTPSLNVSPTPTGFSAQNVGGDQMQLTINKPANYPVFYLFQMVLGD
ncbi:MAG: thrombospondin type 3 repeat-containing protein, partial [Oceanipulchritudo sp.]